VNGQVATFAAEFGKSFGVTAKDIFFKAVARVANPINPKSNQSETHASSAG
jgi:hypothetical protein